MTSPTTPASPPPVPLQQVQASFLQVLGRIEGHARLTFRHLRCRSSQDDHVAEAVALAWQWFLRLAQRGRDGSQFPLALAALAARAARSGRRLCGQERAREVLSPLAQRRLGFHVEPLAGSLAPYERLYGDPHGQGHLDALEERLRDNSRTPVPEQVAFRLDWPRFLATLSRRDGDLLALLGLGHLAWEAAQAFGLSPGRVTQLRQSWCSAWRSFLGETH